MYESVYSGGFFVYVCFGCIFFFSKLVINDGWCRMIWIFVCLLLVILSRMISMSQEFIVVWCVVKGGMIKVGVQVVVKLKYFNYGILGLYEVVRGSFVCRFD